MSTEHTLRMTQDDDELLDDAKRFLQQALGPAPDSPTLPHALALARCSQLNKAELAQLRSVPDDLHDVISPRNEAAAIANLMSLLADRQPLLNALHLHTDVVTRRWSSSVTTTRVVQALDDDTSRCQCGMFDDMRGMACTASLQPGDTVLSVPASMLIHNGIAAASDLVRCPHTSDYMLRNVILYRAKHWHDSTSTPKR